MTQEQIDSLPDDALRELNSKVMRTFYARFRAVRGPDPNSNVSRIARLKVGESTLFEGVKHHGFNGATLNLVRRRSGEPGFKISCKMMNKGLRVTRTA